MANEIYGICGDNKCRREVYAKDALDAKFENSYVVAAIIPGNRLDGETIQPNAGGIMSGTVTVPAGTTNAVPIITSMNGLSLTQSAGTNDHGTTVSISGTTATVSVVGFNNSTTLQRAAIGYFDLICLKPMSAV